MKSRQVTDCLHSTREEVSCLYCLVLSYFSFSGVKEEYRKREVLAFEMETTIASLEEE